jgi:hypothetical protein
VRESVLGNPFPFQVLSKQPSKPDLIEGICDDDLGLDKDEEDKEHPLDAISSPRKWDSRNLELQTFHRINEFYD